MLHTYQAQIHGTQLIWIDPPAAPLAHERVLIVVERAEPTVSAVLKQALSPDAYGIFMASEGCLGQATRQEVDAQLLAMRDEWRGGVAG